MMYIENLQNPIIIGAIPVICGAVVQVVKPMISSSRMFWLPFISVITGIALTIGILITPPDLVVALITLFSGFLPSAAVSVKNEISKKEPVDLGNPPDHL